MSNPPGNGERRNFHGSGNDAFLCGHCGEEVLPLEQGSYRNHCPSCLWSRHVDVVPGDRGSPCKGLMEPIRLIGSSSAGWKVLQRCTECGFERANRVVLDDPAQPDSWDALVKLGAESG